MSELAALLMAADSVAIEDHQNAEKALAWSKRLLAAGKAPHSGDCTKQPHTCLTCVAEEYEDAAERLRLHDYDLCVILLD